jgi:hypothetical protein
MGTNSSSSLPRQYLRAGSPAALGGDVVARRRFAPGPASDARRLGAGLPGGDDDGRRLTAPLARRAFAGRALAPASEETPSSSETETLRARFCCARER